MNAPIDESRLSWDAADDERTYPELSPLAALERNLAWAGGDPNSTIASGGDILTGELPITDDEASPVIERLGFRVADLHLACPLEWVSEIARVPPIYRIPNPPHWFLGTANLRGNAVPIANPARFLGLTSRPERTMLVVFGRGEERAGLLVDDLPDVRLFAESDRLPGLPPVPAALRPHLVTAYEKQGAIWLEIDIGSLLDSLNQ